MNKGKFRSFVDARKFAQKLELKSGKEWRKFTKSANFPSDIPKYPNEHYENEGWEGMGNWLGTGNTLSKEFRTIEDAKKFVQSLGLKGQKKWREYCISGKKPDDIPSNPHVTYKNEGWKGFGDWLGTGNIALKNKKFLSWEDAKKFAQSLNLKSKSEWTAFCHSGKRPDDIPYKPDDNYKNKGWISWGDWLGTGIIASYLMEFRQFENAREFVQSLGLKNQKEWKEYLKSGKRPYDIPSNPNGTYKKDWIGIGDWLGTGSIASQNRIFRTFEDARDFVRNLKLKTRIDWDEYCKSGEKPEDIPSQPLEVYTGKGWKGVGNWLGTGRVANQDRTYLSFEKASKIVHDFKIKGKDDWNTFCKSGKKPNNIPSVPERVYRNKGWDSWGNWLGTGTIALKNRKYLSFEKARSFVRSLKLKNDHEWRMYYKSDKRLDDIPTAPSKVYEKEWIDLGDWLGTGNVSPQTISKNYLSFNEARVSARQLSKKYGIKTRKQWVTAKKKGLIPDNLPLYPWVSYSKKRKK